MVIWVNPLEPFELLNPAQQTLKGLANEAHHQRWGVDNDSCRVYENTERETGAPNPVWSHLAPRSRKLATMSPVCQLSSTTISPASVSIFQTLR
jgi:hypothetical protein